jgi:hypothetical protein
MEVIYTTGEVAANHVLKPNTLLKVCVEYVYLAVCAVGNVPRGPFVSQPRTTPAQGPTSTENCSTHFLLHCGPPQTITDITATRNNGPQRK